MKISVGFVYYLIVFFSLSTLAEDYYSLNLISGSHEIVWLRTKKIMNKDVSLIGYLNPFGQSLERVLPRKEFQITLAKLENLFTNKNRNVASTILYNPICNESVEVKKIKTKTMYCLDFIDAHQKNKLLQWVRQSSNLVIGDFEN